MSDRTIHADYYHWLIEQADRLAEFQRLYRGQIANDGSYPDHLFAADSASGDHLSNIPSKSDSAPAVGAIHTGDWECSQCHALPGERHTHTDQPEAAGK